jgi:hypothetical protein
MRGLDPRIHLFRKMDCIGSRVYPTSAGKMKLQVGNIRLAGVKPGNDDGWNRCDRLEAENAMSSTRSGAIVARGNSKRISMDLNRSLHVMRGLDPRIHLFRVMDCRVKPGNDGGGNRRDRLEVENAMSSTCAVRALHS